MTRSTVKLIAALTMLVDHAGLILFPKVLVLRCIGRIAMPLFAYFIAEGCVHTRSRKKYLVRLLALGIFCQIVFAAEEILRGNVKGVYLNILFTFSLSVVICSLILSIGETADKSKKTLYSVLLAASLALAVFVGFIGPALPFKIETDYGFSGIMLPVFGVLFTGKRERLVSFAAGLVAFNIMNMALMPVTWYSLFCLPILFLYNGEKGKSLGRWAFYIFYPVHLGVLYLLKILIK